MVLYSLYFTVETSFIENFMATIGSNRSWWLLNLSAFSTDSSCQERSWTTRGDISRQHPVVYGCFSRRKLCVRRFWSLLGTQFLWIRIMKNSILSLFHAWCPQLRKLKTAHSGTSTSKACKRDQHWNCICDRRKNCRADAAVQCERKIQIFVQLSTWNREKILTCTTNFRKRDLGGPIPPGKISLDRRFSVLRDVKDRPTNREISSPSLTIQLSTWRIELSAF